MTRLLFWDVDTLTDFMRAQGKLYVPGSEEINPQARGAHAFAHARRIPIVASADDHTESDAEISDARDWSTNVRALLRALEPEAIVIYGVATDFCDKYTVEGLLRDWPRAELFLVTDAIRAIYAEPAERLVASWSDRDVHLTTAAEVLAGRGLERYLPV